MAGEDDEDDRVRDNGALQFRPVNVPTPGLGPRGTAGTPQGLSSHERNALVNDVYVREGDQLTGPYLMVNMRPGETTPMQEHQPQAQAPDNSGKVHFHETGDPEVDRFFQERGEVMVPDQELAAQREAGQGHDQELERLHDMAKSDNHEAELNEGMEQQQDHEHEHDNTPEDYLRRGR